MATAENSGLLPAKQIELIKTTWDLCKKAGLQSTGIVMFFRLFEIDPELLSLFPFRDEEISENNEGMKKHGLGVMKTIDTAITLVLENNLEELVSILNELGTVHTLYSVDPIHFTSVGEALIYALSIKAGAAFTEEAKAAWIFLYGVVKAKMIEGMEDEL